MSAYIGDLNCSGLLYRLVRVSGEQQYQPLTNASAPLLLKTVRNEASTKFLVTWLLHELPST